MAFADKSENEFTPFDDVDLLEAETSATVDTDSCIDKTPDVAAVSDTACVLKSVAAEQDVICSKSDTDIINAPFETCPLDDRKDIEDESLSLYTEVDRSRDSVAGDENLNVATELISISSQQSLNQHSSSLSSEVVNFDVKALPSGRVAGDVCLETSTAVLTLDSDADSPQRHKTDVDLSNGDEIIEVNVPALQQQVFQLTSERDELRSLYSQSKEEIDNYQEQMLEVQSC